MRIRDSDLPKEEELAEFFNPKRTLERLGLSRKVKDVADFGCGYGTFTIPAIRYPPVRQSLMSTRSVLHFNSTIFFP